MKTFLIVVLVGLMNFSYANSNFLEQTDPEIKSAIMFTNSWLGLIDNESYEESWDKTTKNFKSKVLRDQWGEMVTKVKQTYGSAKIRNIFYADYEQPKTVVSVKFKTTTSTSKKIRESIYLEKENGKWKISGYWVK